MSIITMIYSLFTNITRWGQRVRRRRLGRVAGVHTLVILSILAPNMALMVETVRAFSPPGAARRSIPRASDNEDVDLRTIPASGPAAATLLTDDTPFGTAAWAAGVKTGSSFADIEFAG